VFQFLGRNSGRSDVIASPAAVVRATGFNSSVGILVVRTRFLHGISYELCDCFNSSVGILVVRTYLSTLPTSVNATVSIPRSEFWSFGRHNGGTFRTFAEAFQFLGRNSGRSDTIRAAAPCNPGQRFNSSVGILVVRTNHKIAEH